MTTLDVTLVADDEFPEAASPFVTVLVDGTAVAALLDTGAATSAVVERPGLRTRVVDASGTGVFGIRRPEERRADVHMALGGIDVGMVDVQVVPPDHAGHGNLVGQDVLGRWCCEYRLAEGRVELDLPPLRTGFPLMVGARGHVTCEMEWPGGVRARGLIDTGASLSVVDLAFATAHPQLFRPGAPIGGVDADGNAADTTTLTMAGPSLLGSAFPESVAVGLDLAPIQKPDAPFELIVGWPLLRHGAFTVDPTRRLARHRR